MAEDPI